MTELISCPAGKTGSISIPSGVTSIGSYAFYYCTGLTSISIPGSVTSIGGSAFYGCSALKDVYYGGSSDQWQAITIGSSNSSLTSAAIHYIEPLGMPTITSVSNTSKGVEVKWNSVTGAASYQVMYKISGSSSWTTISGITGTSYTRTGLTGGTTYLFTVRAVAGDGTLSAYDSTGISITIPALAVPVIADIISTGDGVRVSWNSVTGAEKYSVWYKLKGSSAVTNCPSVSGTSYTKTGLTAGTTYEFWVEAVASDTRVSTSDRISFTRMTAPAIGTVALTATGVKVTWNEVTGADSYKLLYKVSGSSSWTIISGISGTSYTKTGLTSGKTYVFTVRAAAEDGSMSDYDTTGKSITYMAAPTISSVSNTSTGVQVKWGTVTGAAKYRVSYKATGGGWIQMPEVTGTSYTVTGLTSGTTYSFLVRSINSDGTMSSYNTKSITYLTAPAINTAAMTATGVKVTWNTVTGASTYQAMYKISGSSSWTTVSGISGTSYTVTGLTSGKTYVFTVRAAAEDGSMSDYDTTGKSITYMAAPTISSVSNTSTGVQINWGTVTGAAKYRVSYKATGDSWIQMPEVTGTSYTVTGLTSGTTYSFLVRSINSDGTMSSYNTKSITYLTAPAINTAAMTATGVKVTWNTVTGASTYQVMYKISGSSSWTTVSGISGTSYTVTGLTSGETYVFTVRAVATDGSVSDYDTTGKSVSYLGSCGLGLVCELSDDGTLTISGTGVMDSHPWKAESVKKVIIESGVQSIVSEAFKDCSGLTEVTIPASVTDIGSQAFAGCTALTAIKVDDKNTVYVEKDDVVYTKDMKKLVVCPAGKSGSVQVSNNVIQIAECAFYGCSHLTGMTIPVSVTSIGGYAFAGCSGLMEIFYPGDKSDWDKINIAEGNDVLKSESILCSALTMSNVSVSNTSKNSLGISWEPVTGAEGYQLRYRSTESNTWTNVSVSNTSMNISGLQVGMSYTFTVRCLDSGGKPRSDYAPEKDITFLTAPEVAVKNTLKGIALEWQPVLDNVNYRVMYRKRNTAWMPAGETSATSFTMLSTIDGEKKLYNEMYYFMVQAVANDKHSSMSGYTEKSITYIEPPTINSVSNTSTGVQVKWNTVTGAAKYRVSYKVSGGSWTKMPEVTGTSYTVTGLTLGKTYSFLVRAIGSDGRTQSAYNTKSLTYLAAPAISSVSNTSTGVQVKWGAVKGAAKYRVSYKISGGSWTKMPEVTETSYTVTGLASGKTYSFLVRAIGSDDSLSGYNTKSLTYMAAPTISSVSNTSKGVQVKWGKVTGAAKYRVSYKISGGSWTKMPEVTGTSYTVTGLTSGKTYSFLVRAIGSDETQSGYNTKSITYVAAPTISSLSKTSAGVTISWGKVTGAVNYRVYYKVSGGSWTKAGDTTGTSYTVKGLKSGTTYYFTVRCVSADGQTNVSGYNSTGKSIKY